MNIPRAEHLMQALITPRIVVRLFVLWCTIVVGGAFVAIVLAVPGAVFAPHAEAQGTMAPLWFDEFANTDITQLPDARTVFEQEDATQKTTAHTQAPVQHDVPVVLPERLIVEKLAIDVRIDNPTSTNVSVLDEALHTAVVRYPGSGTVEDPTTNMLIFGHSSYLPVVRNPLYKAFNGIQNLTYGDEIRIQANGKTYVYEVFNVRKASANDDRIPLETGKHQVTLLTCDSFGKKSDRFIVEAQFVRAF